MLLIHFAVLQLLDLATTLWFLREGVAEANPLLRAALAMGAQPVVALAGSKLAGFVPAWLAWRSGRHGLLRKINFVFAACVVWNLAALWVNRAGR